MGHFQKWGVGTEYKQTVYVFQNREGRIVNAKNMLYGSEGKRDHGFDTFSLKQPDDLLQRFMICLFGEHLLDPLKAKIVIIVESEKSALIASFFYPEFDWLACGANTGLSDAKIPAVFGRQVVWLCDADKAGRPGKSNSSIRKLEAYGVNHQVLDMFPDRTDGYDIADYILDTKGQQLQDLSILIAQNQVKDLPESNPEILTAEQSVIEAEAPPVIAVSGQEDQSAHETTLAEPEEKTIPVLQDFDVLLAEAARSIVKAQKAIPATIQRTIKVGYNRAGRIMDQLESIGIVSAFDGSKPRDVIFKDLATLNEHLALVIPAAHKPTPDDHSPAEMPVPDTTTPADPEGDSESDEEDLDEEDDETQQSGLPLTAWHNPEIRKMFRKYGFVEWQGKYWFATYDEKNYHFRFKAGSNFVIRPLFLIISKSNPKRIYEVKNCWKKSKVVDLDPSEFVQLDGFRKNVESQGNFIFMGNAMQFMKVKSKLFDESKEAVEVKTLGYHPDGFYAFANGIQSEQKPINGDRPKFTPLDKDGYGIVEHGDKRYFIPPLSRIYMNDEDEYQNAKKFIYNQGSISFGEYAKLFCDVHGDNGRIGLLYYVSCLFRDIIFDRFRCFPHLFLFGPPQSGKSTMAWSINYLFGRARPPFALNTGTSVGFYKHFAEFRNAVVWFDEYLNSIDWGRVQSLKTAYDGNGHTKSDMTADNRNKSIPVSSGCIVSGQELPTADIALFTRCILLQYDRTEFTHEERQRLDRFHLRGKNIDFGHITAELSIHRGIVENNFFEVYNEQFEVLKGRFSKHGIDDRLVKNLSVLLSIYEVLKNVLEFPFSQDEIRNVAGMMLKKQNSLIAGSKETSTFWNLVEFMYRQRMIKENDDFVIKAVPTLSIYENGESTEKILDVGRPKKVLFMRLPKIQPLYLELHRKQYGKNGLDPGSLKHYLVHSKGFHGSIRNVKFGGSPTSALAFDYDYFTDTLDGFSLEGLNEEMELVTGVAENAGQVADNQMTMQKQPGQKDLPF